MNGYLIFFPLAPSVLQRFAELRKEEYKREKALEIKTEEWIQLTLSCC